ncbi:hypothetical protein RND59_19250 [Vibrio ruber]|uniref:hypothetical protein n=1 Tax=Vibrio ruber TaxID=184755 RepID=UPI0028932BE0|nr:hypothetical protein [Vibrio ruber]WNJ97341.1 hypothetical protein RND59_19250 [Vibrio ruber]
MNENIEKINNDLDLSSKSKLSPSSSGDYNTDGNYNVSLASLRSDLVKNIVDQYINEDEGFSIDKAKSFANKIPREEISEDIEIMYNYLVNANG